jgi:Holliday junction resolvase RusA-like endonuclease
MLEFVIRHKVVPYTRTTQRKKWVDPKYAKYRASQDLLRGYFHNVMVDNGYEPLGRQPIQVAIVIHLKTIDHRADLDNQIKAVIDAAQGVVFPFDGWIDAIYARRRQASQDRVFMLIAHEPVSENLDRLEEALDAADWSWLDQTQPIEG